MMPEIKNRREPVRMALFLGACLIAVHGMLLRRHIQYCLIKRWPVVEGHVVSNRIIEKENRFAAEVIYAYSVEGKTYKCDRIRSGKSPFVKEKEVVEAFITRYPEGDAVQVHYDPANPENARLSTKAPSIIYFFLSLGFMGGFYILFLYKNRAAWHKKSSATKSHRTDERNIQ
jgi:hypothetical protein